MWLTIYILGILWLAAMSFISGYYLNKSINEIEIRASEKRRILTYLKEKEDTFGSDSETIEDVIYILKEEYDSSKWVKTHYYIEEKANGTD